MKSIDLNCDLGEREDLARRDVDRHQGALRPELEPVLARGAVRPEVVYSGHPVLIVIGVDHYPG